MIIKSNLKVFSAIFLSSLSLTSTTYACSRILHVYPDKSVYVGRNMDWIEEMQTKLIVYPRGIERSGLDKVNPLKWTSKYGSIVATSYDIGSTDGMNEVGLSAHGQWLEDTDYGKRDTTLPGLSLIMWSNFYLDNFKTVDEAIRYTQSNPFQVLPLYLPNVDKWIKVHASIEDATGDSAIIEFQDGVTKIYHSNEYTIMTNEPFYNLQLENLKQYDGFGGSKAIPGTDSSMDRFVRAAYHGKRLPNASTTQEAVAGMFSVLHNIEPPFSPFPPKPTMTHRTIWRTVSDLTHHVYYFNSTPNFTTVYAQLDKFNLNTGAPVMKLDLVKRKELSGDVSSEFEAVK